MREKGREEKATELGNEGQVKEERTKRQTERGENGKGGRKAERRRRTDCEADGRGGEKQEKEKEMGRPKERQGIKYI